MFRLLPLLVVLSAFGTAAHQASLAAAPVHTERRDAAAVATGRAAMLGATAQAGITTRAAAPPSGAAIRGAGWWGERRKRFHELAVCGLAGANVTYLLLAGVSGPGAVIGLAISFPLVLLGGLGGGDAKLLAAVGAFLGPADLPVALLVTALVGGAMAFTLAVQRRALGETLRHARVLVGSVALRTPAPARNLRTPGALTIPYGVAIGAGAIAGWLA